MVLVYAPDIVESLLLKKIGKTNEVELSESAKQVSQVSRPFQIAWATFSRTFNYALYVETRIFVIIEYLSTLSQVNRLN